MHKCRTSSCKHFAYDTVPLNPLHLFRKGKGCVGGEGWGFRVGLVGRDARKRGVREGRAFGFSYSL